MEQLSKQQENFCEISGIFGVLISLSCLIQHLFFMIPDWITISIIGIYILSITGFVLLMTKSIVASPILLISTILIFLVEVLMILSLTFSLVLIILMVYLIIIVAVLYAGDIQSQLKKKRMAARQEKAQWDGII